MRKIVLGAVLLGVWCLPVIGTITMDGDLSDWAAAGLLSDDPVDNPDCAVEILRYGATVSNGMLYAVVEINRPVSDFEGTVPNGLVRRFVADIVMLPTELDISL